MDRHVVIAALAAAALGWPAGAAEAPPNGAGLALSCAACHGTDGKSPGAIPSLYGKSAPFIEELLRSFKSGARPGTVMNRLAKGYSDAEIQALAAHFAAVK